jgi:dTMP kinase
LGAPLFSFPRYAELPVGPAIRRSLQQEAQGDANLVYQCLNIADKLDAAYAIRKHLSEGVHVVCDRWIPSSYCYGAADGLDTGWLERMHASLPQADLNILLDVAPEEALRRRPEARDRYEKDRTKQEAVRANYEALWARNMYSSSAGWIVVDGALPVDEVEDTIRHVVTIQREDGK